MGLLRRLLWWRNRYPSWSFWLGLVITILLSLSTVIFWVVLAAVCLDLVKLISRWIWERLQDGARRRRLSGATVQPPPAYRTPPPANQGHPDGSPPGRDGRADLPTDRGVRILVLGFPGCGKTLMLAGLYYYFAQGGPTGIRLSTDQESNGRLLSLVAQIRTTPGGYFPPGTSVPSQ